MDRGHPNWQSGAKARGTDADLDEMEAIWAARRRRPKEKGVRGSVGKRVLEQGPVGDCRARGQPVRDVDTNRALGDESASLLAQANFIVVLTAAIQYLGANQAGQARRRPRVHVARSGARRMSRTAPTGSTAVPAPGTARGSHRFPGATSRRRVVPPGRVLGEHVIHTTRQ